MKKYFAFILFAIVCNTYSQINTDEIDIPLVNLPDPNIPTRTLQDIRSEELNNNVYDSKDENLEKALEVVAPIDNVTYEPNSVMDFVV